MRNLSNIAILLILMSCDNLTSSKSADSSKKENSNFITRFFDSQEILEPKDYMMWIIQEKNGLKIHRSISGVDFTLQYKPLEYMILNQSDSIYTELSFSKEKKNTDSLYYFTLNISISNSSVSPLRYQLQGIDDYQNRVNYFSFRMQKDFILLKGEDTLRCLVYNFEPTYELTLYNTFVLGFEKEKTINDVSDLTFIYDDKLFNLGPVKMKIQEKSLRRIPKLKFI